MSIVGGIFLNNGTLGKDTTDDPLILSYDEYIEDYITITFSCDNITIALT